ncbi:MAG: metal-binding protein [Cyanobacteria bacterium]|nr:metal-binding protein [Cyanobacteriota bacterium]
MPSGRTHDRITGVCAPVVVAGSLALWQRADVTLAATLAFVAAGLMFGPDLDIYSNQVKRWGPLQFIWLPYQGLIKHRSPWSHWPLLGTAVRLLYLLPWLLALAVGLGAIATGLEWLAGRPSPMLAREGAIRAIAALQWLWQEQRIWIWSVLGGLEVGAASHYIPDHLSTALKRSRQGSKKSTRSRRSPRRSPQPKAHAPRSAKPARRPAPRPKPKGAKTRDRPRARTQAPKTRP